MAGFEWKDQRSLDGIVFVRALRSLATINLPKILPDLDLGIAAQIDLELGKLQFHHGENIQPSSSMR